MNLTIMVRLGEQYGRPVLHPACTKAQALADIAGTRTLTPQVLRIAKERLGITVLAPDFSAEKVRKLLDPSHET